MDEPPGNRALIEVHVTDLQAVISLARSNTVS